MTFPLAFHVFKKTICIVSAAIFVVFLPGDGVTCFVCGEKTCFVCRCTAEGCNQKFGTKSNLKKHVQRKHENQQKLYSVSDDLWHYRMGLNKLLLWYLRAYLGSLCRICMSSCDWDISQHGWIGLSLFGLMITYFLNSATLKVVASPSENISN